MYIYVIIAPLFTCYELYTAWWIFSYIACCWWFILLLPVDLRKSTYFSSPNLPPKWGRCLLGFSSPQLPRHGHRRIMVDYEDNRRVGSYMHLWCLLSSSSPHFHHQLEEQAKRHKKPKWRKIRYILYRSMYPSPIASALTFWKNDCPGKYVRL